MDLAGLGDTHRTHGPSSSFDSNVLKKLTNLNGSHVSVCSCCSLWKALGKQLQGFSCLGTSGTHGDFSHFSLIFLSKGGFHSTPFVCVFNIHWCETANSGATIPVNFWRPLSSAPRQEHLDWKRTWSSKKKKSLSKSTGYVGVGMGVGGWVGVKSVAGTQKWRKHRRECVNSL